MSRYKVLSKLPKDFCQRQHFKNRFEQRFGIPVNGDFYAAMLESVQNVKSVYKNIKIVARFKEKQSNRLSMFDMFIGDIPDPFVVVYDNQRKTLVTALYDVEGKKYHDDANKNVVDMCHRIN